MNALQVRKALEAENELVKQEAILVINYLQQKRLESMMVVVVAMMVVVVVVLILLVLERATTLAFPCICRYLCCYYQGEAMQLRNTEEANKVLAAQIVELVSEREDDQSFLEVAARLLLIFLTPFHPCILRTSAVSLPYTSVPPSKKHTHKEDTHHRTVQWPSPQLLTRLRKRRSG
jgi:hypothetical protein